MRHFELSDFLDTRIILSIISIIVCALLFAYVDAKNAKMFAIISAVAATALFYTVDQVTRKYETFKLNSSIRRILDLRKSRLIFLAIEDFPTTPSISGSSEKPDFENSLKDTGESRAASFSDLAAANYIGSAIADAGVNMPAEIEPAKDSDTTQRRGVLFICVGLYTNSVIKKNIELFSDFIKIETLPSKNKINIKVRKKNNSDWAMYEAPILKSKGCETDYGVIAKARDESGNTLFWIGGTSADGTKKLAYFLSTHWQTLAEYSPSGDSRRVKDNPFIFVIRCSPGQAQHDAEILDGILL